MHTRNPGELLHKLATQALLWPMGSFHRTNDSTLACVLSGREIPEHMLPGRFLMRRSPQERALLTELSSGAPWPRNDVVAYCCENNPTDYAGPWKEYEAATSKFLRTRTIGARSGHEFPSPTP